MAAKHAEDQLLEDALEKHRELIDFYKRAAKRTSDEQCKRLFKHLQSHLADEVGDVAAELARHRMERSLGRPVAPK